MSALAIVAGTFTFGVGVANAGILDFDDDSDTSGAAAAIYSGVALMAVGGVSLIATGALLGARKRKLREPEQALHETSRRARRDVARSRLVF